MNIYAIKDCVVGEFMPQLYLFPNDDTAKRWFESAKTKADYPKDLQLYFISGIDLSTGVVTASQTPVFLM